MQNRNAFIDFVKGLLSLNPLERWSPQQAKLHPFITQQKFTGPFVPPMNLKAGSLNRSPAPGIQQQQQAEALSKQRHAQQDAQIQAQQNASALAAMQMGQYPQPPTILSPGGYGQPPYGTPMPPPYAAQGGYGQPMGMLQPPPAQLHPSYAGQQNSLHAQAATRAGRQRASTLDQQQGGIPASLQRVISHLDPNAPIRLQPSPAYHPPPADGSSDSRRRPSRAGQQGRSNRDFIRTLEDQSIEEAYMSGTQQWH